MTGNLRSAVFIVVTLLVFVSLLRIVLRARIQGPPMLVTVPAFLSSPVIHVSFSFFLGWKDYMPFFDVPSLWEL